MRRIQAAAWVSWNVAVLAGGLDVDIRAVISALAWKKRTFPLN